LTIDDAWPKAFGFDVGWKKTAGIWGAHDTESDIIYLYSEHYRGYAEPSVHASSCKTRGSWIPCIIDSAAHGSNQENGRKLFQLYQNEGLKCMNANKAVDAGLLSVYKRLPEGRLKVSKNLVSWLKEYRIYRRDEKGRIVKSDDHLMDATRYLIMGVLNFQQMPVNIYKERRGDHGRANMNHDPFESQNQKVNMNYDPWG